MVPGKTALVFAAGILNANILIGTGLTNILSRFGLQTVLVETTNTHDTFYLLTIGEFNTRVLGISHSIIVNRSKFTQFNLELIIVALCPDTFQRDLAVIAALIVDAAIIICISSSIQTSFYLPMVVNLCSRFKTEQQGTGRLRRTGSIIVLCLIMLIRVTSFAVPLNHVRVAFEVSYANTEVVEFFCEFSSQFVNQSLVNAGSVLSHSFSNHLSHFVTGDVTVALEGRVAITFDNAISSQLAYSVICPMVSRNIGERICSSESCACSANNQSGRQSRYESLLHENLLLQK